MHPAVTAVLAAFLVIVLGYRAPELAAQTHGAPGTAMIGAVHVEAAWARATPPNARTGAIYLTIRNTGSEAERLTAAASPAAATVELHTHVMEGGVARMQQVEHVGIKPGETAVFRPGGFHIMLIEHLYSNEATMIWPHGLPPDEAEVARIRHVLADEGHKDETWIESTDGRHLVRGVVRVNTGHDCQPCHEAGRTLGAASLRIDFTDEMAAVYSLLRKRVGLLLVSWLVLVGGVAAVVRYTVRRSLSRLESDLRAAAAGQAPSDAEPELPLDPSAAEFHRRVRVFLSRQRAREAEVASRLVHVDQLASLGQLSAGLAHEIKNPLAGIHGALEVLKHETSDDTTSRLYDEMLEELKRVNGILERLLESGRPAPLRLARTSIGRLVTETVELVSPALGRKKVEVLTEVEDGLPEIQLDAAKIRQVLLNLIQNAAEAMGEGGGHVMVRGSALAGSSGVVLVVEDDGPGISRASLEHLFEPKSSCLAFT